MDRFSFLNAAHTDFFAQLYDQYLDNPDSVEPSWRSFFKVSTLNGNRRGTAGAKRQPIGTADYDQISEKLHKEFNVLKLIEGYRTVGICLQNKSRKRQKDF
jgi:2-oxoglutarate dehydrogenase E1 component